MQYAHDDLLRVEGGFVCRFGCEGRAVRRVDVASRDVSRPADALARLLFGATRADAQRSRTCIRCRHRVARLDAADEREFALSGLCPRCFDEITLPDDDAGSTGPMGGGGGHQRNASASASTGFPLRRNAFEISEGDPS
jgi:hypothetical protein